MNPGLPVPQRPLYSDHSLIAYLGSLVQGRRVGVVGPSSGDVAKRARALGASTVVAFGGTGEGVAVRPLANGSIEAFQGRLDVIVIPDAAAVPLTRVLDEARYSLGQDGVVVVGTRPPGSPAPLEAVPGGHGPDFHSLQDALAERFANVSMLGRGPFIGYVYARVDGDGGEPVTLDTRLLPDEAAAAEAFIAVASDRVLDLDGLALIQVPQADILAHAAPAPTPPPRALEEELARREAKIKELENASAERWVRVQKLENELKNLDEEARKARDRAVRLSKDLEDERKLRQRNELDGQILRRAQEIPGDEAKTNRERVVQLEKELEAAKQDAAAKTARLADLGRELDEAQSAETELRAQLDAAEKARKQPAPATDEAEFVRMESELRARAEQVLRLEYQMKERDGAIRELVFSLEALQSKDSALELQSARERISELGALNTGLAAEAQEIVVQNDVLREQVKLLETELKARGAELEEARKAPAAAAVDTATRDALAMAELRVKELSEAVRAAEDRALAADRRAEQSTAGLSVSSRQLEEERVRASELLRQLTDSRNELSTQYAMVVSMEDRLTQVGQELEGARAGYARRVRELEREVESLVQALEVVGTHSSDEDEKVDTLMRDLDVLRAEKNGVQFRLRDAEMALAVRAPSEAPVSVTGATVFSQGLSEDMRNEQLLADLAETAARLATTEESLVATREAALAAERRAEEMAEALSSAHAELRAVAISGTVRPGEDGEQERREAAERELLVRSLVAQLEDRDLRLRALERRLVEEVERARRTESEIWEVELRARDQRIANLSREIDRTRGESAGAMAGEGDMAGLRRQIETRERELESLRGSIETVRTGLSNILVDGRGAVVAHDLVNILRQIEEPGQG